MIDIENKGVIRERNLFAQGQALVYIFYRVEMLDNNTVFRKQGKVKRTQAN